MKKFLSKNWPEIIFTIFTLVFSFWLMTKTFYSNPQSGIITIAGKAYSDFAANIPLIRSFSYGANFPPEYPLFPGEPIRYHFLFYLLVGLLEKAGIPLGWALNLPSILSFWALLLITYLLAKLLFKNRSIAILSVLFLLFNGSLGFYYFFQKHPLSLPQTFFDIINTQAFSAFGPYDGSLVTAFWNLNIYTNQRHFASGLFFTLLPLYLFLRAKEKKQKLSSKLSVALGLIIGFLPFWHASGFMMSIIILVGLFIYLPGKRSVLLTLFIALVISFPQFLYLNRAGGGAGFQLHPGYLIASNLSFFNFLRFWLLNLGLGFFLIPLGVFFAPRNTRYLFWIVLPIFFVGNIFQFSVDMAINHKFFNLFIVISNMFTAYAVYLLWRLGLWTKLGCLILIFFLTLSGVIDIFAIKNDNLYAVTDAPTNRDIAWIKNHTPPSSVFLNSSYLYHPASLAGRKIFLGWPYFSWSAGYDTDKRADTMRKLYQTTELAKLCHDLKVNGIDYITTEKQTGSNPDLPATSSIFEEKFVRLYINPRTSFTIYGRKETCRRLLELNN